MNQFVPSALINLSSSIKSEPSSTQRSVANSTTVGKMPGSPRAGGHLSPESNQVLTKKKLHHLVREGGPNEQLDEAIEQMLQHFADYFIENVVTTVYQLGSKMSSCTGGTCGS
ncbi:transcription initiation factor TFIID subunit 12-like [Monodelphis domestica]|uniref:transcription initiation factor TFIID subunit 12-like n=1 Tax=Monodelphis domestica TaxID=13616 RepID=UPI0024E21D66|nr:transcription initiation factor TFIID subunit 12-like [Monodelphis domestica]